MPLTLLLVSLLGFLGEMAWFLDLFSHFRAHYILIALTLIVVAIIIKIRSILCYLTIATVIIVNIYFIAPYYPIFDSVTPPTYSSLKVISINLNSTNTEYEKMLNYIRDQQPDFLVLLEVTPAWGEIIKNIEDLFPYAKAVMQNDNFGIGIASRYPIESAQFTREDHLFAPFLVSKILNSEVTLNLVAVHPFPPINNLAKISRENYWARLAKLIPELNGPTVLCGDFNNTPWTKNFNNFSGTSKLELPKIAWLPATWPTQFNLFALPIDHCLISSDIKAVSYRRGPNIGSDHYPLEMKFVIDDSRLTKK